MLLEIMWINYYIINSKFLKLFPKNPHTYGNTIPSFVPVEEPILDDLSKSLSGF